MSRVDWGWVAALTVILWPFAYSLLTAIRHTARALATRTRRTR